MAVASFLTALQTWVLQRNSDTLGEDYDWILGRLTTADWADVRLALPFMVTPVFAVVLATSRRSIW